MEREARQGGACALAAGGAHRLPAKAARVAGVARSGCTTAATTAAGVPFEFKNHCVLDLDKKFDLQGVEFREIKEWETTPTRPTYPETYT